MSFRTDSVGKTHHERFIVTAWQHISSTRQISVHLALIVYIPGYILPYTRVYKGGSNGGKTLPRDSGGGSVLRGGNGRAASRYSVRTGKHSRERTGRVTRAIGIAPVQNP